jgi:hypothetical protein
MGWTARGRFEAVVRFFSSPSRPDRLWGPPNEYRGLFLRGIKLPGHEADRSPASGAEVNNVGAIPPLPYVFMA